MRATTRRVGLLAAVGGIALLLAASYARAQQAAPSGAGDALKKFTLVSVLIGETKFWLPSTIIVDEGDKVELTLKNQVPGAENQHGFTIPDYKIVTLVTRGTPTVVSFTADKSGVFPYFCQLHSAHVGGQLVVLSKHLLGGPAVARVGDQVQDGAGNVIGTIKTGSTGMMHPEGAPQSK